MSKNNKKDTSREVNISTKVHTDKSKSKVNGGVFVYTGAISLGQLATSLNIPSSDIMLTKGEDICPAQ